MAVRPAFDDNKPVANLFTVAQAHSTNLGESHGQGTKNK